MRNDDDDGDSSSGTGEGLGFVVFLCVGYLFVAMHAAYQFRQTTLVQSKERTPSATGIRYVHINLFLPLFVVVVVVATAH